MTPRTIRIAPSLLSADFARLGEEVRAIEAAGADLVHFDVMDNHYVPNLTIGPMVCEAVRRCTKLPIDVHLMVEPVDALVPMFAAAGADIITFHPEASRHVHRTLALIREHGCEAGLVFNPATPLDWATHVMDQLDMILLDERESRLSVASSSSKARSTSCATRGRRIDTHVARGGRTVRLEVDGGVKGDNIARIARAGADTFVAGSAVFGAPDPDGGYRGVIGRLREQAAAGSQSHTLVETTS